MKKGLYIVATPIGNIADISERAKELLNSADVIACEDTRVTKKLLNLLNISLGTKKFIPLHDHNEQEKSQEIIDMIVNDNLLVVQVSDAGSPLISDPGYKLIRLCHEQKVPFFVVPGCCAIICALQMSGLPTNRFMFAGFIPNKDKAREDLFKELAPINTTLVFYETAPRLLKTLSVAAGIFKSREFAVAREITKLYEECLTGMPKDIISHFEHNPPKGEIVFMVAPPTEDSYDDIDLEALLREKLIKFPLKTAVKEIVQEYKLNKNEVYRLAIKIKDETQ